MTTLVRAGGIATPDGVWDPTTIVIRDGLIDELRTGSSRTGREVIQAADLVVGAGLIDLHTHGAGGAQVIDGSLEAMRRFAAAQARHGVTAFLATIGGSVENIERGIAAAVEYIRAPRSPGEARCLGIHLEGPFINPERPGAFIPATILPPDIGLLDRLASQADGWLRRMTLAPEVPGMAPLIRRAISLGIGCSAGHSAATATEMLTAVEAGVEGVTHVFNAMPGLHHRSPGLLGVALTDDRVTVELIADGVHVDPLMMRLLQRVKGWPRIALITDSIAAAGLPDGSYRFEEQDVTVRDGEARLADGTLNGSTSMLDDAVRRFAVAAEIPWHQAHASASLVPARTLGVDDRMGAVQVGLAADLVGFDEDRQVRWTMIGGDVASVAWRGRRPR
ncbi:MAG: N-acetylglucosamine-6-phosphate deacetylase [Chloroflexi bacterium]|nr:N-acetylglucosamine-6-phosphate deacetylase [Chloroflexota bacterium]